jgi:hypothetical protein
VQHHKTTCISDAKIGREFFDQRFPSKQGGPGHDPSDDAADYGGPRPAGHAVERAGANPGGRGVDPVVRPRPVVADARLGAGEEHGDHADPVAVGAAHGAAVVEDAAGAQLQGLAALRLDGRAGEPRDGAREVADAGAQGEVLAPGAALPERLLLEEDLGRGRELVERAVRRVGEHDAVVGQRDVAVRRAWLQPGIAAGVGGDGARRHDDDDRARRRRADRRDGELTRRDAGGVWFQSGRWMIRARGVVGFSVYEWRPTGTDQVGIGSGNGRAASTSWRRGQARPIGPFASASTASCFVHNQ